MPIQNGDFGFIGPSYVAADPYQDSEDTINYYPEIAQAAYAKGEDVGKTALSAGTVVSLLGCPGLIQVASVIVAQGPSIGTWDFSTSTMTFDQARFTFDGHVA